MVSIRFNLRRPTHRHTVTQTKQVPFQSQSSSSGFLWIFLQSLLFLFITVLIPPFKRCIKAQGTLACIACSVCVWASFCTQPDRHGLERREMAARASEANLPRRGRFQARKVFGWPKRCRLAHAFLQKYSYKRLKLAQLLGQLGVFLTSAARRPSLTQHADF